MILSYSEFVNEAKGPVSLVDYLSNPNLGINWEEYGGVEKAFSTLMKYCAWFGAKSIRDIVIALDAGDKVTPGEFASMGGQEKIFKKVKDIPCFDGLGVASEIVQGTDAGTKYVYVQAQDADEQYLLCMPKDAPKLQKILTSGPNWDALR